MDKITDRLLEVTAAKEDETAAETAVRNGDVPSPKKQVSSTPTDDATKESVQMVFDMSEELQKQGEVAEQIAKSTADDPSMVRDRIDKSLRKFSSLVNRRFAFNFFFSFRSLIPPTRSEHVRLRN